MNQMLQKLSGMVKGIFGAVYRYPLTVLCLLGAAGILCYMVATNHTTPILMEKLIFTFLLGAILGAAAQSFCERFSLSQQRRTIVFIIAAAAAVGYYLLILPAPEISTEVTVRTLVAVFAMLCAFLWLPSYKGGGDFNAIALTHFKNAFISVLYSAVVWGGLAAIIATIDALLFDINNDAYLYMSIVVWVLFAPLHYLARLPWFNSDELEHREYRDSEADSPKFLNILISYIAIPLITAYTAVLAAYFVKILFTLKWPSGQLGPMVLAYCAIGLIVYVLACRIENKFALLYVKLFPKIMIPVVIMQLVSVAIRLNAYGITESRFYVALFGVFSLVCGIVLSFMKEKRNGIIALLAAGFALISILPPIDAFTTSRVSQISRLETILRNEQMLMDGKVTPKSDATDETKQEVTSIVNYLDQRGYLPYVKWMPSDFKPYEQMKEVFGFESFYKSAEGESTHYSANISNGLPLDVSGFDKMFRFSLYSNEKGRIEDQSRSFEINGRSYQVQVSSVSEFDKRFSLQDSEGRELVATQLYEQAQLLAKKNRGNTLTPEEMTFDTTSGEYTMRIVFEDISITKGRYENANYSVYVLVRVPK